MNARSQGAAGSSHRTVFRAQAWARAAIQRAHRSGVYALAVLLLTGAALNGHAGSAAALNEYEVKALLLRQLVNYVEWPANAPTWVCVVGNDPFGPFLERAFADQRVRLRRLSANSDMLAQCGLVFVAASEAAVVPELLARLAARGALSISDMPRFTEQGGMISMLMVDRRVRFRIDLEHARSSQLRINAKLLQLAEIVSRPKGKST